MKSQLGVLRVALGARVSMTFLLFVLVAACKEGQPGEDCNDGFVQYCVDSYCNADGFCQEFAQAGDDCSDAECGPGSYCSPTSGRCAAERAREESCAEPEACVAGTVCREPPVPATCIGDRQSECWVGPLSFAMVGPSCLRPSSRGEACSGDVDGECASGLACFSDGALPTCQLQRGLEQPCADHQECRTGLSCNLALDPPQCSSLGDFDALCAADADCQDDLTCEAGTCRGLRAEGGPCSRDADCQADLHCSAGLDEPVCVASLELGATCSRDRQCEADMVCSTQVEPRQCVEPAPLGGTCGGDGDCPDGARCQDEACVSEDLGQECLGEEDCASPGLVCLSDESGGECMPTRGYAESCSNSADCEAPLRCTLGESGSSCRFENAGDACQSDVDCGFSSWCLDGICHLSSVGDTCTSNSDCFLFDVCHNAFEPARCHLPSGSGEPCLDDGDCADMLICNEGYSAPRCESPGWRGDACAEDADCANGPCSPDGVCGGSAN